MPGLIAAAAAVVVHWPVLDVRAISFDDAEYVLENPLVRNPGPASAVRFFTEVLKPSSVQGYYQPLPMLSLMLDAAAVRGPEDFRPFHLTSLLLHGANVFLVVLLLHMLVNQPWAAGLAGLLFAAAPMTVDPIAWLGERKTLLAAFFALGCLICYVQHLQRRNKALYLASLVLFVLAVLSKPTVTAIPLVLLVVDWWLYRPISKEALLDKTPFLAIAAASAMVTVISQQHVARSSANAFSAGQTLLLAGHNLTLYVAHAIWPVKLAGFYPFPDPVSFANSGLLLRLMLVIAAIPLLLLSLRWTRALATGAAVYLLLVAPTLFNKAYSPSVAWDKYAYLALVGLLFIAAWGLATAMKRINLPSATLLALVVVTCVGLESVAARRYLAQWQATDRFMLYMISMFPDAEPLHTHLGWYYERQGRKKEAFAEYREAVRLNPASARAQSNLGVYYYEHGELAPAINHLRAAVAAGSGEAGIHMNLGLALWKSGDQVGAGEQFAMAADIRPEWAQAHLNLGTIMLELNYPGEAAGEFQKAVQLEPDSALAHRKLGQALARLNQIDPALWELQRSLRLARSAATLADLGEVLLQARRPAEAAVAYREALGAQPDGATRERVLTALESLGAASRPQTASAAS